MSNLLKMMAGGGRDYATLSPTDKHASIAVSGNTATVASNSSWVSGRATLGKSTGKWFYEVTITTSPSQDVAMGVSSGSFGLSSYIGTSADSWGKFPRHNLKINNSTNVSYGSGVQGDVIGVAFDMAAGTLEFYRNGVSEGQAYSNLTGTLFPAYSLETSSTTARLDFNFGATAFAYSVPSGFNPGVYI